MTAQDVHRLIEQGWQVADRDSPQGTVDYFAALKERLPGEAYAEYAYACALDFAGDEAAAVAAYETCRWEELDDAERRRGKVQYASTLRNVGRIDEALTVIEKLRDANPSDPTPIVFEALVRVDRGEAVHAVQELLTHIVRTTHDDTLRGYRWALERYIAALPE